VGGKPLERAGQLTRYLYFENQTFEKAVKHTFMKSHFTINGRAAIACAVAGTATMLGGRCAAQTPIAADYATNSIYNGGWTGGQNGGYGFGAWSFNGTDASPAGQYQGLSSSSSLGTAWTLLVHSTDSGIANVGRAIPGGLQVGQTFQTVIQNPINNAGIYSYRGFDILFTSGSDNDVGGDNSSALRLTVFDYFNPTMKWAVSDAASPPRSNVSAMTTGASGMLIALTLNSTNTYTLVMSPVGNPATPYLTYSGTLVGGTNLPINYVNFRLWNTPSSGIDDTANNFSISSMSILSAPSGPTLNAQPSGANVVLSWSTNAANFVLASSLNLTNAVWNTNFPAPVVVGNQNFVTNPISGPQQFYRLQLAPTQ